MTPTTALPALKSILDQIPVRWVLIGALAANRYRSSARMTGDIDLLLAGVGDSLASLEDSLIASGWTVRRADPEGELLRITHADYGTADLLISGTEYQQLAIDRAISEKFEDLEILVLTPEDVILHKLIAGRFQDLADIEAILETSIKLDLDYLTKWINVWEAEDLWVQLYRA